MDTFYGGIDRIAKNDIICSKMLSHTFRLATLAALAVALPVLVYSFDPLLTLKVAVWPVAVLMLFGFAQQFNLNLHIIDGKIDRAKFVPWRPSPIVDVQPSPPVVSPPNSPNNSLHASRSVVLNANGQTGQLSLEPASSDLVAFLNTCIRISAEDRKIFPTVRDLKRIGVPYETYDNCLALLGDAVDRKSKPASTRNGVTLGQLRRMALGQDVVR